MGHRRILQSASRGGRRLAAPRTLAAALLVAAATSGLAACSTSGGSPAGSGTGYVADGAGQITSIPTAKRQPAPQLSGTTLDGTPLSLSSLRGKVVVVNVWGSWCGDCRAEEPILEEVYEQTRSKGVQFVGIDTQDQTAAAKAFVRDDHVTFPSLQDPTESLVLRFKSMVPATTVPSTVIIDRQGRVAVKAITTFSTPQQLLSALDPVISGS